MIVSSEQFTAQVIDGTVKGRVGSTPYSKIGELGVAFYALALVLLVLTIRFLRDRYI